MGTPMAAPRRASPLASAWASAWVSAWASVSASAWVFWVSARMQWRSTVGLFSLVTSLVMPASFLVVTSRVVDHPSPELASRMVVAVVLMSLWASTVWGAGGILRRELRDGTFAAAVSGLRPPQLVLLGKSLGGTMYAVAVALPTTAATVLLLDLPVRVQRPFWVLVGGLVVVASGTALGMLLACLFLLTRYGPQLSSALLYPIYLLGGLLIPPQSLPAVLEPVAAAISLRWATEFLVAATTGRVAVLPLAVAVGLTVLYFGIGHVAFAKVVDLARGDGRLVL